MNLRYLSEQQQLVVVFSTIDFFCTYLKQCFSKIPLPFWKLSIQFFFVFFNVIRPKCQCCNGTTYFSPVLLLKRLFPSFLFLLFFCSFSFHTPSSSPKSCFAFFFFFPPNGPDSPRDLDVFFRKIFLPQPNSVRVSVCAGWQLETLLVLLASIASQRKKFLRYLCCQACKS